MIRLRGNMIAGKGAESRHRPLFEASAYVHRIFGEEIIWHA